MDAIISYSTDYLSERRDYVGIQPKVYKGQAKLCWREFIQFIGSMSHLVALFLAVQRISVFDNTIANAISYLTTLHPTITDTWHTLQIR